MAIQNFLSGGFYGKVGDVVGQRWHNKRILRSHVIPFNPRTELQQSNRAQFALATALAQQAYNINKGSDLWDTTNMGQFSQLVSVAKRRLQAGKSPAEALPLYPDGYNPSIVLSAPSISWSTAPFGFTLSDTSYTLPMSRSMMIEIQCMDEYTGNPVFLSFPVTIPANSPFSYQFITDHRHSFPAGSNIQAVSTDDISHSGSSIQLPVMPITQNHKPSLQINIFIEKIEQIFASQASQLYWNISDVSRFFMIDVYIRQYDSNISSWVNQRYYLEYDPPHPPTTTVEIDSGITFPPGSYVIASNDTYDTGTAFLVFSWPQYNFNFS